MGGCKLKSGANCQGTLKEKGMKQGAGVQWLHISIFLNSTSCKSHEENKIGNCVGTGCNKRNTRSLDYYATPQKPIHK